jgi:hypothetical protein
VGLDRAATAERRVSFVAVPNVGNWFLAVLQAPHLSDEIVNWLPVVLVQMEDPDTDQVGDFAGVVRCIYPRIGFVFGFANDLPDQMDRVLDPVLQRMSFIEMLELLDKKGTVIRKIVSAIQVIVMDFQQRRRLDASVFKLVLRNCTICK